MGFVILIALIVIAIGIFQFAVAYNDRSRKSARANTISFAILGAVLILVIMGVSYTNYIRMAKAYAVIEQYKTTITYYSKKGVAEFKTLPGAEFTDLKYNNYQQQLGEMTRELRDKIVEYNGLYAGKLVLKDSWVFSALITLPEGTERIVMNDIL